MNKFDVYQRADCLHSVSLILQELQIALGERKCKK